MVPVFHHYLGITPRRRGVATLLGSLMVGLDFAFAASSLASHTLRHPYTSLMHEKPTKTTLWDVPVLGYEYKLERHAIFNYTQRTTFESQKTYSNKNHRGLYDPPIPDKSVITKLQRIPAT
jgi:hypothetical protein